MMLQSAGTLLRSASTGRVFEAELISLTGKGKLRITNHWHYSALNCDPRDESPFSWTFVKVDEEHVAMGPSYGPAAQALYASVRDDWGWYVQTQEPNTGRWIRWIQRDEILVMKSEGLQMVQLQGFNGQLLAVDAEPSVHPSHTGFRLRSIGSADPRATTWFLGITSVLQTGLTVPTKKQLTADDVRAAFASSNLEASDAEIAAMHRLLHGPNKPTS